MKAGGDAGRLELVEWLLGGFTILTALAVWWYVRQPHVNELGVYGLFPLFGLVAFGLMWVHFVAGALRRYCGVRRPRSIFRTSSMYVVLVCIIMHPTLLWLGLWRDDFGLPPMSQYLAYGGTAGLNTALFVGMLALNVFLVYELKRWFDARRWWRYIEWLQLPAMLMIFFHGLTLGGELAVGWYLALWWLYGLTLLLASGYSIYNSRTDKEEVHATNS